MQPAYMLHERSYCYAHLQRLHTEVTKGISNTFAKAIISAGCSELTQELMEPHPFNCRNALHGLFEAGAGTVPLPELLDDRNGEDLGHVSQACLSPE